MRYPTRLQGKPRPESGKREHEQRAVHKTAAIFTDLVEANSFHLPFPIRKLVNEFCTSYLHVFTRLIEQLPGGRIFYPLRGEAAQLVFHSYGECNKNASLKKPSSLLKKSLSSL